MNGGVDGSDLSIPKCQIG